jgi:hypothetical protein
MTFAARTLGYFATEAGGGGVVSNSLSPTGQALAYDRVTASITFLTDGNISYFDPDTSYGSIEWFTPTGGTPGNNYWIKATRVNGILPSGMTSGTIYSLSSNQTIQITAVANGQTRLSSGNIDIYSDSAGTTRVGGGTYELIAQWLGPPI